MASMQVNPASYAQVGLVLLGTPGGWGHVLPLH